MRLGAQMSTAGGLHTAFQRGQEAGCDTILVFTKSNRQWQAKPLTEEDIARFKEAAAETGIVPDTAHASYLINVASPDPALWEKSYQALKTELERANALGIPTLTFHPGSYMESSEEVGLEQIARALHRLLTETVGYQTIVCLELMAGQGTNLGHRFEHMAYLLERSDPGGMAHRLGVCFDTCHVFAAGYDFRTPDGYRDTMALLDRIVGLDRIKCFHLNDSQYELGTRRDRHAHIGEGHIGLAGFSHLLNDPRWTDHAGHLETPKTETDDEGSAIEMDPVNLAALRALITW
jgi:deoxyribonuclease-4